MSEFDFTSEVKGYAQAARSSTKDKYRATVYAWRRLYAEICGEEYGAQSNHIHVIGKLYDACRDLQQFCDQHHINYEHYVAWALTNIDDIYSPRYLVLAGNVEYYKSTLIPEGITGYCIIATGENIETVYKQDGQVMLELPATGEAYDAEGNQIYVIKAK